MLSSKWVAHRIGLIDFWYYDDEEFIFEEGRMLLRGANGSGKSVTMQSFIPLLLDANRSPGRLDPFGSRDRKLENYLLEEGDGRQERTGYLFMEFKRSASDTFLTIGMGLRAREYKALDSWYFCVTDGRRIGEKIELYKKDKTAGKLCLTKGELKICLGAGGQVLDKQSEYMDMVNKLLFGFSSIDEYGELINLLIQLRTPKLSKDFKPTVINEILSASLPALTDEDLRPMSEAIENMDNLKSNLESLQESKKSADRIMQVFDRYNRTVLLEKVKGYTENKKKLESVKSEIQWLENEHKKLEEVLQRAEFTLQGLEEEQRILTEQKNALERDHADAFKLKEALEQTQREFLEQGQSLAAKKGELEAKRSKFKSLSYEIEQKKQDSEVLQAQGTVLLKEMGELSQDFGFSEQALMEAELDFQKRYDFSFTKNQMQAYEKILKDGIELLREKNEKTIKYSSISQRYDELVSDRDIKLLRLEQAHSQLLGIKGEIIEKLNLWAEKTIEVKLKKDDMTKLRQAVVQFVPTDRYLNLKSLLEDTVRQSKDKLNKLHIGEQMQKEGLEATIKKKQEEIFALESTKEVEPVLPPEVVKNRQRLQKLNVPFVPFYKLISFKNAVSDETVNAVEEALNRMGLLTALVVPQKYKNLALKTDKGMCDSYIFCEKSFDNNLGEILSVEQEAGGNDFNALLSEILKGIGLTDSLDDSLNDPFYGGLVQGSLVAPQEQATTYVSLKGDFKLGLLYGTASGTYVSQYIGEKTRERTRLKAVALLKSELESLQKDLEEAEERLKNLTERLQSLDQELSQLPGTEDIHVAGQWILDSDEILRKANEAVSACEKEKQTVLAALEEMKLQLKELAGKVSIPLDLEAFKEGLESLGTYRNRLNELMILYHRVQTYLDLIVGKEEQLNDLDADTESLRYDIGKLEGKLSELTRNEELHKKHLEMTNYEQVKEQIDTYLRRLGELPQAIKQLFGTAEATKKELKYREDQISVKAATQEGQVLRTNALKQAVSDEYGLGYVPFEALNLEEDCSVKSLCQALESSLDADKSSVSLLGTVQDQFYKNLDRLTEYNLTMLEIFEDKPTLPEIHLKRVDIVCKLRGKSVKFMELLSELSQSIEEQNLLLKESDKEIFEDILTNTIGKKISARIYKSEQWVEKMNSLMKNMNTSSGLALSLEWKRQKAETEEQMNTGELVELLKRDAGLMKESDIERLGKHFRSKIAEARKRLYDSQSTSSFHAIMKDILDYRKWFEFQLYYVKTGEKKRELTNKAFFQFSGGEKAMSMYVPLFSAVVAKYQGASEEAPKLLSLDEAFAGVDDHNVQDMFRLMAEFDFNFIINSQVLWGDYETIPRLAIYQLHRPNNVKYVTVIRYIWNGHARLIDNGELKMGSVG